MPKNDDRCLSRAVRGQFGLKILVLVDLQLRQLNPIQTADKSDLLFQTLSNHLKFLHADLSNLSVQVAVVTTKASVSTYADDTAFPTRKHEKQICHLALPNDHAITS